MPHSSSQAFLRELDKKLWTAADRLRSNLDAAVYKHAVLGLIFLKYVSDSFARRQAEIEAMLRDPDSDFYMSPADYAPRGGGLHPPSPKKAQNPSSNASYEEAIRQELEERDYYIEKNVFWVPPLARWKTLQDSAKLPPGTEIPVERGHPARSYKITSTGKLIDDALDAIEKENAKLKGVPVASVYDRRTLKSRSARRQSQLSRTSRRRTKPWKTSDNRRWRAWKSSAGALNRRPTLQLQIDPANLGSLIDLIATIPFSHTSSNSLIG